MAGAGCKHPLCIHARTGAACKGGCKWDESGVGIKAVERHKGLVALRQLALAWDVPTRDVFRAVGIPRVADQRAELQKMILGRGAKLDFVRPSTTQWKAKHRWVPKDDEELDALTTTQVQLMNGGTLKNNGTLWEDNRTSPRCCKYCCASFRGSISLQILYSRKGTVLEWCLGGIQVRTRPALSTNLPSGALRITFPSLPIKFLPAKRLLVVVADVAVNHRLPRHPSPRPPVQNARTHGLLSSSRQSICDR